MNIQQIKKKIDSKEYDFLRNDIHLGNNIILLTLGGSYAYGLENENSDLDIRGIAIENKNEIIGLKNFEQFINEETDTTIYGLRKLISLILNCNPNTIEMLGTKPEHLFICTKYGKILRDNIDLFLSKKAIGSFGGYANQQLRRLENALCRNNYSQSRKEEHMLNTIKRELDNIEGRYKELTRGNLNLYIDKSEKESYDTEIFMDCNLEHYPLRDFKNIYSEMKNVINGYEKLNHRNSKKDEYHLNKHASHLIRLLLMGSEILKGEGVNTYRENDRQLLLDIKNGKYTYEEIFTMVDKYEKEFKYASDNTCLPSKPNYKRVEELLMNIYEEVISNDR